MPDGGDPSDDGHVAMDDPYGSEADACDLGQVLRAHLSPSIPEPNQKTGESQSPASAPVATPCRAAEPANKEISRDVMMKRLSRCFAPRANGTYLVPDELLELWRDVDNGGRDKVIEEFKACGFDKESDMFFPFTCFMPP